MSSGYEIEKISETYRDILNILSSSSEDYFFFWDFETGKLEVMGDIGKKYPIIKGKDDFYTIKSWIEIVYPRDTAELEEELREIYLGKKLIHNMEYRIIDRNGEMVWVSCRGKAYVNEDGRSVWMLGRISDTAVANKTDRLTGAWNADSLKGEIENIFSRKLEGYLLLIGVDNLKTINLKSGREYGDNILKGVCRAVEDATDGGRRIYRMNGDCFAVTLIDNDENEVKHIFSKVQKKTEGKCTLSAGCVSLRKYFVTDAWTLYQYAENSLDYAKAQGKNTIWFFSADDYEKNLAELELKDELQKSVKSDFSGFYVVYQPQIISGSYELYGAEALLRYYSPERGNISPSEFVPILEQGDMICEVGIWVLKTAIEQCKVWRKYIPDFKMSINMSYIQLRQPDIAEKVLEVVEESGLHGSVLTVEITESMQLMDYPYLNEIIDKWKLYGIEISVDDFGTGYSGLSRLKEMEIDEIKIDRCFVSNIQNSAYNYRLMSNIIELADSSGIRVRCEGVETEEELATLEELRPSLLQGFLFSKPCEPEQFEDIYINPAGKGYRERIEREQLYRGKSKQLSDKKPAEWTKDEIMQSIIEEEKDIVYVSDVDTYEMYYLNPSGQKIFGVRDYRGKKCYKVLRGKNEPCAFCTNNVLRTDDFYIWDRRNEYCGRHYLLKDRLVEYKGRKVRLEAAFDITNQHNTGENMREKLRFAENVVKYTKILSRNSDYEKAVNSILAAVGEFYRADRAYLFEPDKENPQMWDNTFEWCKDSISSQIHSLQNVEYAVLERWMDIFRQDKSVIILNLDTVKEKSISEWDTLNRQNISRLIAVPVWDGGKIIGFVGVDNPRYSIHDDSQLRVLSHFLADRIRQRQNELKLKKMLEFKFHDILDVIGIGLWIIRIDERKNSFEMFSDDTMYRVLGASENITPAECYDFWYSRIGDGYYQYVNESVQNMIDTDKIIQLEYTWKHPEKGEVVVRCTGKRVEDDNGAVCLKGYHRIISDIERPKFLPDVHLKDVFEYHETKNTVFFHTDRALIFGEETHESDFPGCWVEKEIIHPHFICKFQKTFSKVRVKKGVEILELLLKSKSGMYEWFKLTMRHLRGEKQNLDTVLAVLEPIGAERMMELEYTRMSRFYKALLSEAMAYAEVDLESGQLKTIGGIWKSYEQNYLLNSDHFIEVLKSKLSPYLSEQELAEIEAHKSGEGWNTMFDRGEQTHRYSYRRSFGEESRWVELVIHIFREEITQNVYALIYLKDINNEKERELAQSEAAKRDPLTNIYNRTAFEREVTRYVKLSAYEYCGALMVLDIDNFKQINDNRGHLEGDKILRKVSQILVSTFRDEDVAGRLGGDEFLVFVKGAIKKNAFPSQKISAGQRGFGYGKYRNNSCKQE